MLPGSEKGPETSDTCEGCACFGPLVPGIQPGIMKGQISDEYGTCRREPPKVVVLGSTFLPRVWPMPHRDDWCACCLPRPTE